MSYHSFKISKESEAGSLQAKTSNIVLELQSSLYNWCYIYIYVKLTEK